MSFEGLGGVDPSGGIDAVAWGSVFGVGIEGPGDESPCGGSDLRLSTTSDTKGEASGWEGVVRGVEVEVESAVLEEDGAEAAIEEVGTHGRDEGMCGGGARPREAREEAESGDMGAEARGEEELAAKVEGEGEEAGVRAEVGCFEAGVEEGGEGGGFGEGGHGGGRRCIQAGRGGRERRRGEQARRRRTYGRLGPVAEW
nr:hypothetical protein [Polyangium spumosum]